MGKRGKRQLCAWVLFCMRQSVAGMMCRLRIVVFLGKRVEDTFSPYINFVFSLQTFAELN